ncbi:hypothetical protein ACBJ59_15625 [Nonomuraea sp. MTCD27]|uniref:hypothetical protein n=1 Tax=Nonomuraea sp. MTCD27 TaxID=1676747 RepID=UPI0035C02EA1
MLTPIRKIARPATHGLLAVTLAVTMAPAASAASDPDKDRHFKGIHSDRGFRTDHHGDDGGRNCRPHTFFRIHKLSPRNFFVPRTRYTDGPGGSMTVSVTREHEVLAFLESENEKTKELAKTFTKEDDETNLDTKTVLEQLRRLGLPHLEERHMVFTGHEYTREISDGKYGNMWYRVFGYRVGWSAWSVLGTCDRHPVDSGIANVPSRVEGWRYWETKHPMFKRRLLSVK